LGRGGEEEFVAGSIRTSEAQAGKAQDALEMGEQHLDLLATTTGLHVLRSGGKRAGHVAGVFVQIPRDLAGDIVRATLRFEFTEVAVQFAGAINPCPFGRYAASGSGVGAPELNQFLARRAGVTVALGVEFEIDSGECAIGSI
jgi:hypothetical protein